MFQDNVGSCVYICYVDGAAAQSRSVCVRGGDHTMWYDFPWYLIYMLTLHFKPQDRVLYGEKALWEAVLASFYRGIESCD